MKTKTILVIAVIVVAALCLGLLLPTMKEKDVVGIYHNENWNGREATLILNEDGTCQYPGGASAKWTLKGDTIIITVTSTGQIFNGTVEELVTISEHQCRRVKDGIILHEHLFVKVD